VRIANAERAVIDQRKIIDYVLSTDHPSGRNKARVFKSTLGLAADQGDILTAALRRAVLRDDAVETSTDEFGQRYRIDFDMSHSGRSARIRSAWLAPADGASGPHFLTCYVV
jgi:hypothetical protein